MENIQELNPKIMIIQKYGTTNDKGITILVHSYIDTAIQYDGANRELQMVQDAEDQFRADEH